jgi:hypothetical protein
MRGWLVFAAIVVALVALASCAGAPANQASATPVAGRATLSAADIAATLQAMPELGTAPAESRRDSTSIPVAPIEPPASAARADGARATAIAQMEEALAFERSGDLGLALETARQAAQTAPGEVGAEGYLRDIAPVATMAASAEAARPVVPPVVITVLVPVPSALNDTTASATEAVPPAATAGPAGGPAEGSSGRGAIGPPTESPQQRAIATTGAQAAATRDAEERRRSAIKNYVESASSGLTNVIDAGNTLADLDRRLRVDQRLRLDSRWRIEVDHASARLEGAGGQLVGIASAEPERLGFRAGLVEVGQQAISQGRTGVIRPLPTTARGPEYTLDPGFSALAQQATGLRAALQALVVRLGA